MSKRVLIITYYWPPSAGSGVQRWFKFAKYLPDFDWEPIIFTPENPDFDLMDESLSKEISPQLEVIKFPIWEPYSLLNAFRSKESKHSARVMEQTSKNWVERAAIWARANLLVPDPRVFWVKPSVKFLSDLVEKGQFDAVITTGPPHSMHLIGLQLKQKFNIKWIADFRDPWSQWEFLDTLPMQSSVRKKHQKLEKEVLQSADQVLTISPTFQSNLSKLSGRTIQLLTNGYDDSDLPIDFLTKQKKEGELHLVYSGIIDAIRNPIPLLKAMKEEFQSTDEKVKLTFVGRVSDTVKEFVSKDPWISSVIDFPGYVTHKQVFEFYAKADALVLILTNTKNAKGNIPGKVFEYMATELPIVALGDPKGDTSMILENTAAGVVLSHHSHLEIQIALRKLFEGKFTSSKNEMILPYSRRNLTRTLASILNESPVS